jgi:hypothetical protein
LPPVPLDAAPGYILARSLEVNGRPVAFAFAGNPAEADGASVFLNSARLRSSLNYALIQTGQAYPLFYETLFVDLRTELAMAAQQARASGSGLWPQDASQSGVAVTQATDLEVSGVMFPKLFRRVAEYLGLGIGGMDGFLDWLAATLEQVIDLTTTNATHFDTFVSVQGDTVQLTMQPDQLVFISAK